jgi:hypothetical protein
MVEQIFRRARVNRRLIKTRAIQSAQALSCTRSPALAGVKGTAKDDVTLPEDSRRLNCQFDLETIEAHFNGYAKALSRVLLSGAK